MGKGRRKEAIKLKLQRLDDSITKTKKDCEGKFSMLFRTRCNVMEAENCLSAKLCDSQWRISAKGIQHPALWLQGLRSWWRRTLRIHLFQTRGTLRKPNSSLRRYAYGVCVWERWEKFTGSFGFAKLLPEIELLSSVRWSWISWRPPAANSLRRCLNWKGHRSPSTDSETA